MVVIWIIAILVGPKRPVGPRGFGRIAGELAKFVGILLTRPSLAQIRERADAF